MKIILSCLFVAVAFLNSAQTSEKYNSVYASFFIAEELYEKGQYGAARKEFRSFINTFQQPNDPFYQKARYYEGISALELFNNDAVELLINFNKQYPESIYKHLIFFKLGNYYYQKKDFKNSLLWYDQLKALDVEENVRDEYYFKVGYANFKLEKFVPARNAFHEIIKDSTHYSYPALYYYSHIAYQDKSYQTALEGFKTLQNDPRFSKVVPYYIAQIYYLQGNYEEVTNYAPKVLDTGNLSNTNDLNHIIGDAFYRVGKFDEAVPFLEQYNKQNKTTREDDYELAYSYFRSKSYSLSIRYFDRVCRKEKDKLSQTSYYHIGEAYLAENKFGPARAAFEEASVLTFDPKIQEDALYQYAILSYKLDINPYDEAVEALELYLSHYPNSERKNDVYQYLVNVYTSTNNYKKALESLDRLPNKDIRLKTAYQMVAFNSGVEQFQKSYYKNAIAQFKLVEKYPIDPVLNGKSRYWQAEAHFHLKEYDKAIKNYRKFINLPGLLSPDLKADAYYNIGYAYYAKRDTLMGIESFRTYTQQLHLTNKRKLADAFLRAGDGCYLTKQNENAAKFYLSAFNLKAGKEDQALYYLAKTYTFIEGAFNKKTSTLLDIINNYPNSKYTLLATEELAGAYKSKGQHDDAMRYYQQIVTDYPTSNQAKNARVEIAALYYQKHNFQKAEIEFKMLLEEFGDENEICQKAATGLIDVYKAIHNAEKAEAVMTTYSCAGFTKNEAEDLYYTPAFEMYEVNKDFEKAIPLFEKYIAKHPEGNYKIAARYQLADCYYLTSKIDQAIEVYANILIDEDNKYTEIGAIRSAKYFYNSENFEQAIPYYQKIEAISLDGLTVFNARLGLTRSNFSTEQWAEAVKYSELILVSEETNENIRLEAEYAKGIANYHLNEYDSAKSALKWVAENTTTIIGAEAKYYLADIAFTEEDLDQTDKEVRELLKMKPAYNYWVAKALILKSRALIIKEDLFQAEQTLNSVIEHYPIPDDGIVSEATNLLDELMQLKNKPKEVGTQSEPEIEINEGNE